MRRFSIVVSLSLFLFGCSSSTNVDNQNTTLDTSNANIQRISNANSKLIPYKTNANAEVANGGQNSNVTIVNRDNANNRTKFEERPAPDNSVFESKLDEKGYTGTRTFKDHPVLLKIVQTQNGNEKHIKVYLKNGKVYDVTEKEVPDFKVNSPDFILAAIGLGPKADSQKNVGGKKKETSENDRK